MFNKIFKTKFLVFSYKVFLLISRNFIVNYCIHYLYHFIFKLDILNIPRHLIYDIRYFAPTFGDFTHCLSAAEAICKKYNKKGLDTVTIIIGSETSYNKNFINNIAKPICLILNQKIKVNIHNLSKIQEKNLNLGRSVFPYIPIFRNYNSIFKFYDSIDLYVLAKILDLRVFGSLSINKFKDKKYDSIYKQLEWIKNTNYFCFVLRDIRDKNPGYQKSFYNQKNWDPSATINYINKLLKKGENVVIINPIDFEYKIDGTTSIPQSTYDPLIRYFIYQNAQKVYAVSSGPASLLMHSKKAKYIIYDQLNISKRNFEYEKKWIDPNKDWVYESSDRISLQGNILD